MTRKWKCSPRYTTFFMTLKMRVIYCTIFLGQDTIFMTIIFACHRGSVCHKFGVIKGPFSSSVILLEEKIQLEQDGSTETRWMNREMLSETKPD